MKTKLNISIDVDVAIAAKNSGLNISMQCERALKQELNLPDSAERVQARKKNPDRLYVKGIGFVDKNEGVRK